MIDSKAQDILTKRELEILKYILNEYTSSEIAELTKLSIRTVETHRKHILKKTNSKSLVGLVKNAIHLGMMNEFIKMAQNDTYELTKKVL